MNHYIPPYTITSKILKLSTQISEELTKLQFAGLSKVNPMLRKKNRIKTLAGTLEIEGNFLGEEKITAILDGKTVLGTVRELAEVQGAIKAYEKLDEYRFDELDDLLHAHKILMSEILTSAGSFRSINVQVGGHIAPQPSIINDLMINLFSWLKNSDEHILLKSCIFHYEFEFIHPFNDGNGRIGRLWQSVILNSFNPIFSLLPTESIVRDYQEQYYSAIENSTQMGESTPFIEFMLEMILKSMQNTLKSDQESNYKSDQKVLALMKEDSKITIYELMEKLSMSESGIKKVIKKLKDEDIISRVGSLKSGHWEILSEMGIK
ncbi:MAG: cell filamentation protein Fic [Sulfurimonas sp. RIFOXYD12_FULL_33_39]|uniref:Fic family protein n=1 Tax=unclassified Sulfurimonas TaxID=2623549 RepID=UPI0008B8DFF3|nr:MULTISPECIES: Fic family protein [unclassified Sulfurimonas]OHE08977.1 MAG: cell filamentation protein Fic [Sulfurimonas sp. RIFOXYD12_FULL_33_39]OHE14287.1 MAG: cell filamentation protein Fic [Sulfurimonas sp. RIFOXYD2_FULL_34_21]